MSPDHQPQFCPNHSCVETALVRIEQSAQSMREGFEGINKTLKEVAGDLRNGAIATNGLQIRLNLVERLVFGAVGTALVGLLMAVLALVLKS